VDDQLSGFVTLIKTAGPNSGALLLAAWGVWGGQYAAKFDPHFAEVAQGICIAAMAGGVLRVVLNLFRR
jgi:hypothetical protein